MVNSVSFEMSNKMLFKNVWNYEPTDAEHAAKNGQVDILYSFRGRRSATD